MPNAIAEVGTLAPQHDGYQYEASQEWIGIKAATGAATRLENVRP
jgi:hypothetical protein